MADEIRIAASMRVSNGLDSHTAILPTQWKIDQAAPGYNERDFDIGTSEDTIAAADFPNLSAVGAFMLMNVEDEGGNFCEYGFATATYAGKVLIASGAPLFIPNLGTTVVYVKFDTGAGRLKAIAYEA